MMRKKTSKKMVSIILCFVMIFCPMSALTTYASERADEGIGETQSVSGAGIRLNNPLTGEVGQPYKQKVLNICDGKYSETSYDKHTLNYTCAWYEWKDGEYSKCKMLEDELPAGLTLSEDGWISGTPTEAGYIQLWFNISWDNGMNWHTSNLDGWWEECVYFHIEDPQNPSPSRKKLTIGNNPTPITVNQDFILPANSDRWYSFESPMNGVSFNSLRNYLYGSWNSSFCDANGYSLDMAENPVDWLFTSAGETYYCHLKNDTSKDVTLQLCTFENYGSFKQFISEYERDEEDENYEENPFSVYEKTQTNVERKFAGDDNTKWDVYKCVISQYKMGPYVLDWRCYYLWWVWEVIAPYKVHFENCSIDFKLDAPSSAYRIFPVSECDASTMSAEYAVSEGLIITGHAAYSSFICDEVVNGTSSYSYEIYVPAGKTLTLFDGIWWDSDSAPEGAPTTTLTPERTQSPMPPDTKPTDNNVPTRTSQPGDDQAGDSSYKPTQTPDFVSTSEPLSTPSVNTPTVSPSKTPAANAPTVSPSKTPVANAPTVSPSVTPVVISTYVPATGSPELIKEPAKNEIKKPAAVSKIKGLKVTAGKKKLTIKWKKIADAAGYQLQVSKKKNFKGAKVISLKKNSNSYISKKLKGRKKYYVRIRAYKIYKDMDKNTQKAYGKWVVSSKKTK